MTVREYVGARYVPIFMGEWDNTETYEPLSIVQHEGDSYTSRQYVPVGIGIDNEAYWAVTGNFNAQVEAYRQRLVAIENKFPIDSSDIAADAVITAKIADSNVTTDKIADSNVTTDKIADSNVTTDKIADSNVTTDKIANDAITNDKIADKAVKFEQLDVDSYFAYRKNEYAIVKLLKEAYTIGIKNNNDSSTCNPLSNVYEYMLAHDTFDFAHNCDFHDNQNAVNTYPMRLNGVDFNSSTAFPYPAFAFNTTSQEYIVYNAGTYLSGIPAAYDCVFTCSYTLIVNGTLPVITEDPVDYHAPRLAWGEDDDYYYVMFFAGRTLGCEGYTLNEVQEIGDDLNITNLFTFDGGGSICVCANTPGTVQISNTRDKSIKYPGRRNTPLIFGYKHN